MSKINGSIYTKRLIAILTLSCIALPLPSSAGTAETAQALLTTFGASCPSEGEWTRAALSQTQALITTLKNIQSDQACLSASGAIAQLQTLSQNISEATADPLTIEYLKLERQKSDITFQLQLAVPGSTDETTLKTQLREVQLQIAQNTDTQDYTSGVSNTNRDNAFRKNTMGALVSGVGQLLDQTLANQECFMKYPSLLAGVTSLAGSVSAAALSGGAALGVSAGTKLMGILIENAQSWLLQWKINHLSSILTSQAYQCVLESLSNQWCSAQDALNVVTLKASTRPIPQDSNPVLLGMKILDRDIPTLLKWLDHVRSGTPASNKAMADRQAAVLEREKMVRVAKAQGLGLIAENQSLFDTIEAPNPDKLRSKRWNLERTTIRNLASLLLEVPRTCSANGGCTPATPLGEIIPSDYAPYFLMGLRRDQCPTDSNGISTVIKTFENFDPLTEWPASAPQPFKPELAILGTQLEQWIADARDLVLHEQSAILNPDPLQILAEASTPAQYGDHPVEALLNIKNFLETSAPSKMPSPLHQKLFKETVLRLDTINTLIEDFSKESKTPLTQSSPTPIDSASARVVLDEIFKVADLDSGTVLLANRLDMAVRLSLTELLISGHSGLDRDTTAALLASSDIIKEISRFAGTDDLTLISRDIQKSQTIVQSTLTEFGKIFGRSIKHVLKDYKASADPKVHAEKASLCLKLLAMPEWPKKIPVEYCDGSSLISIFKDGPSSVVVNAKTRGLPHSQRACSFRDFFRANRIYQNYLHSSRARSLE